MEVAGAEEEEEEDDVAVVDWGCFWEAATCLRVAALMEAAEKASLWGRLFFRRQV